MLWLNSRVVGFFRPGKQQRRSDPASVRPRHVRPDLFSIETLEMRQLLSAAAIPDLAPAPLASGAVPPPRMAAVLLQGAMAPAFTLPYYDVPTSTYSLAADPSKVVVLNFFRTDAGLAAQTLPQIQEVYDWVQTQGSPVTVMGVNEGEALVTVQDYFLNNLLLFPAVLDADSMVGSIYDAQQFPVTYVIANGQIAYVHTGYSDVLPQVLKAEVQSILDTPLISITNASVKEGTGPDVPLNFNVSLSWPSINPVTVDYTTVDASALAGVDYRFKSGTLRFNPGETSKSITINVIGDVAPEPTKKFALSLMNPSNALLSDVAAEGTILDDDSPAPPAKIYVDDYIGIEPSLQPTTIFNVTIRLAQPADATVNVDWATADNTAIAGVDYTAASGTATINPGESSVLIPITIAGVPADEPEKSFFINLTNSGSDDIVDGQAKVTIVDCGHTISVADASVLEGNTGTTDLPFKITLSSPAAYPISVDYYTHNGTAIAGVDFNGTTGTVTFAPGETEKDVVVKVIGDVVVEPTRAFSLMLRNFHSASLANDTATGTILDDGDVAPPIPSVSINDIKVNEADKTAVFTLTLSLPTSEVVTVNYATADGTAVLDNDYTAKTGTVIFLPGKTTATVTVPLVNDEVNEAEEAFSVTLADPASCTIDKGLGTATVTDDDPVTGFTANMIVKETTGVPVDMLYTIFLTRPSEQRLMVNYSTLDGTALAGIDYVAASGTLVFAPGEMSKDIFISVIGDATPEADKSFNLKLTGVSPLTITTPQLTGTIVDDDRAPNVKLTMGKLAIKMKQTKPPVNFGVCSQGDRNPTRTFKVANTGTDTLRLGVVVVPAGFKLVKDVKHSLAPGEFSTFTVKMVTKLARHYAGHIRIATNVGANKPYHFGVVGDVVSATSTKKRTRSALSASAQPLAAVAAPKTQGPFATDVKKLIQASHPLF